MSVLSQVRTICLAGAPKQRHFLSMIRVLALLLVLLGSAAPLWAADWHRYVNPRFGAAVDIPTEFKADGVPANVQGDGRLFRAANGRSTIAVWGEPINGLEFSDHMHRRIASDEADGWGMTYRSQTPDWAAWSGTRAGHVFYAKSIATCDGRQTANVRLVYPALDIPRFDAIANRLGASLGQDGACF